MWNTEHRKVLIHAKRQSVVGTQGGALLLCVNVSLFAWQEGRLRLLYGVL